MSGIISTLPAPDFSWQVPGDADHSYRSPPPGPSKKGLRRIQVKTQELFSKIHTSLHDTHLFTHEKKAFTVREMARGTYSAVYEVVEPENGVLYTVPTSELVVKAYHGSKTGFDTKTLRGHLEHSLKNYDQVLSLKLPVAQILNKSTARDEGFIIQEKIPHEIDVTNTTHRIQAQKFITASVENDIRMDLQPQNLKVKKDNTVVLIDFVEDEESTETYITKACRAWATLCKQKNFSKEAGETLLKELTSGISQKHSFCTQEWLADILS